MIKGVTVFVLHNIQESISTVEVDIFATYH
jgi:hypothetical protein